ncbi:MAG: hypothetical protein CM15mP46_7350 [Alphaproteobacteria bacterium]|nr:MAG: hypothetical protein CM15mP46_7350 [Alphaproteobacteria bacterium]
MGRLIDMPGATAGQRLRFGKGITFDSGGLDLKPSKAMEMIKKDMGGAETFGLARLIRAQNQLRVLAPPKMRFQTGRCGP